MSKTVEALLKDYFDKPDTTTLSFQLKVNGDQVSGETTLGNLRSASKILINEETSKTKLRTKPKSAANERSEKQERKKLIMKAIGRAKRGTSREIIASRVGVPPDSRSLINALGAFVRTNELVKTEDGKYKKTD